MYLGKNKKRKRKRKFTVFSYYETVSICIETKEIFREMLEV